MKYIPYTYRSFKKSKYYSRLNASERETFDVLAKMFHFKANNYVLDELISWEMVDDDPIYKLVFPRREMLHPTDFGILSCFQQSGVPDGALRPYYDRIKSYMQPRTLTSELSFPEIDGTRLPGMYSNFPTMLSLYPALMSKTCHAYCSYCARWTLFGDSQSQNSFAYDKPEMPVPWLLEHPEVTDALFTGADPLILNASLIRKFIEPLLAVKTLEVIRISTKALGWWPFRFTSDRDADNLLRLFEYVKLRGKHMTLIAHLTHPRELEHPEVERAVSRILSTGTGIRCQGPLIRGVNDNSEDWYLMWTKQVKMGMTPYYMFVEANHHPTKCFRVPFAESLKIFQVARKRATSLARTVRGPVFVHDLNRVLISGTTEVAGEKYFVLKSLQSPRGTESEGDIRLLPFSETASDFGDLFDFFTFSKEPMVK
ncbi:MAG: lysine 2,3-aminomutase [Bacteroidota bacterium]